MHILQLYMIHFDDAQQTKRVGKTIFVASWFPVISSVTDANLNRVPIYVCSNTDLSKQAIKRTLNACLSWTLRVSASGVYPSTGPAGESLDKGRQQMVGPFAGGHRLVYSGCSGDWKAAKEEYDLPWNYNCEEI